jgi:predicted adenylyl cyclase CyaB
MPANIEIKARVSDEENLTELIRKISDTPVEVIHQEDTFYQTPSGRLKLRTFGGGSGELIAYTRGDSASSNRSEYRIARIDDPRALGSALGSALGVRGVVRKVRFLYRVGNTRIHLDRVEGLGTFLELEVVLQPGESEEHGHATAAGLMKQLGLTGPDLVACAYIDLLVPQKS